LWGKQIEEPGQMHLSLSDYGLGVRERTEDADFLSFHPFRRRREMDGTPISGGERNQLFRFPPIARKAAMDGAPAS
jgi:hypothetical protein